MDKYNSIKEIEQDKKRQKDTENRAIVEAMTDEELKQIKARINEEQVRRIQGTINSFGKNKIRTKEDNNDLQTTIASVDKSIEECDELLYVLFQNRNQLTEILIQHNEDARN